MKPSQNLCLNRVLPDEEEFTRQTGLEMHRLSPRKPMFVQEGLTESPLSQPRERDEFPSLLSGTQGHRLARLDGESLRGRGNLTDNNKGPWEHWDPQGKHRKRP